MCTQNKRTSVLPFPPASFSPAQTDGTPSNRSFPSPSHPKKNVDRQRRRTQSNASRLINCFVGTQDRNPRSVSSRQTQATRKASTLASILCGYIAILHQKRGIVPGKIVRIRQRSRSHWAASLRWPVTGLPNRWLESSQILARRHRFSGRGPCHKLDRCAAQIPQKKACDAQLQA